MNSKKKKRLVVFLCSVLTIICWLISIFNFKEGNLAFSLIFHILGLITMVLAAWTYDSLEKQKYNELIQKIDATVNQKGWHI
jgi:hypothetical protein